MSAWLWYAAVHLAIPHFRRSNAFNTKNNDKEALGFSVILSNSTATVSFGI